MDTFRGHLQLSALGDLDSLLRLVAGLRLHVLDLRDDIHALKDLAEDDVAAVEPSTPHVSSHSSMTIFCLVLSKRWECLRGNDSGDEELGAVGVLAGVGHGQQTGLGVLELEVLVGELVTVD